MYVEKISAFFDHLPPCIDIFYGMTIDKKWRFLDHLPRLVKLVSERPLSPIRGFRRLYMPTTKAYSYQVLKATGTPVLEKLPCMISSGSDNSKEVKTFKKLSVLKSVFEDCFCKVNIFGDCHEI